MAILSSQCPHCLTPQAPLRSVAFTNRHNVKHKVIGFFLCPICEKPVGAWLDQFEAQSGCGTTAELVQWKKTVEAGGWVATEIWPAPLLPTAPLDVPERITRNFTQAEHAAVRDHREAAGMAYRRALELALKDKAPELKGTLEKRIDKLAADGRLTTDLAEWAHSVRDLGNEATHDEDEPTKEDVADLAAFTRVVLEYLYSMPAKVARRAATPISDPAASEA